MAVLEHLDEVNPHLHFYAIDQQGLDVKRIHQGWVAKKDGQDYRTAMKLVQDDYHRDVGSYVGLLRVGPGGQRLDRDDYKAMKVDAEQTRIMLRDIEVRNEANEAERVRVAKLKAEGGAEFQRLQMMGQRMATTMMAHAQRRAADYAALLKEQEAAGGGKQATCSRGAGVGDVSSRARQVGQAHRGGLGLPGAN